MMASVRENIHSGQNAFVWPVIEHAIQQGGGSVPPKTLEESLQMMVLGFFDDSEYLHHPFSVLPRMSGYTVLSSASSFR
jgi:hypothetical protein